MRNIRKSYNWRDIDLDDAFKLVDPEWDVHGVDGAVQNDWYIVPLIIAGVLTVFIGYAGVENVFNVMVEFITSI